MKEANGNQCMGIWESMHCFSVKVLHDTQLKKTKQKRKRIGQKYGRNRKNGNEMKNQYLVVDMGHKISI